MLRTTHAVALAAVLVTPLVAAAPAALRPVQAAQSYTYLGTVHAVKAGSLDLITGVGMALRLVHMSTSPTTLLAGSGTAFRLADVKPGDLVRAECRRTDAGLVASRIERLEAPKP